MKKYINKKSSLPYWIYNKYIHVNYTKNYYSSQWLNIYEILFLYNSFMMLTSSIGEFELKILIQYKWKTI